LETENAPLSPASGELPPVTLEGSHHSLLVTLHLPPALYAQLPEEVTAGNGIKIHTLLFNKGKLCRKQHSFYLNS